MIGSLCLERYILNKENNKTPFLAINIVIRLIKTIIVIVHLLPAFTGFFIMLLVLIKFMIRALNSWKLAHFKHG